LPRSTVRAPAGIATDPAATHIARIKSKELIARGLPDVVVERIVVEYLSRAQWCKELQIVNGLKPGTVLAALKGEDVGTIISA
jgi:molybdenum storage protein